MTDFYVFWCAESKSGSQFAPSRTDFLLHWVIPSHWVINKAHFTMASTSKDLLQYSVNRILVNGNRRKQRSSHENSKNLFVGPFLLPLNAPLGALLGVFFIRGFP